LNAEALEIQEHWNFFGIRVSALIETVVFIAAVLLLDYLFGSGDRFLDVNPHPFWIIILVVTVQYGTLEGIIAAVLCTIALYAGNIPEIEFNESLFNYNARLALNPVLWFVAALVLGEMHMRVINERDKFKEIAITADRDAKQVTDAYQLLKEKKEHLEVRLVSQMRSFSFSIKALQNMESMSSAQIFMSLLDMVREIIGPKKFSAYTFSENGFEVMLSEGWGDDEPYHRRFMNDHPLYQKIVSGKRLISVINPEDEAILGDQGLIAAPIIDTDSGTIFGMLKIEDLEFYDLNISNLWVIESLAELVGTAFSNGQKYDRLTKTSIYAAGDDAVFSFPFYRIQKALFSHLLAHLKKPFCELDVQIEIKDKPLEEVRAELNFILQKNFQTVGTVCRLGRDEPHYAILLPGYSLKNAEDVAEDVKQVLEKEELLKECQLSVDAKEIECKETSTPR